MRTMGELELRKAQILKAFRSNVRLKHSLAADEELNEKLPELEKAIDKAIQAGKVYELDLRSVLEDE